MNLVRPLSVSFGALVLITGAIYPATVTGIAHAIFHDRAEGSLIRVEGRVRGSRLIAQATEGPRYFSCRPSATGPFPTNAAASAGSTLAASNPALGTSVIRRLRALRDTNPGQPDPVPQDLVSSSASGLDPHISPEAARWQAGRVAGARGLASAAIESLIEAHVEGGFLSPRRVNVLELNQAVDALGGR